MKKKRIDIRLEGEQQRLNLICYRNAQLLALNSITLETINAADEAYILEWLLNAVKNIFCRMPVDDIDQIKVVCNPDLWAKIEPKIGGPVNYVWNILKNTNRFLNENKQLKDKASAHKKILLYNVDGPGRFIHFYNNCRELDADNLLYRNMELGWDVHARRFDYSKTKAMALDELVKFIIEGNIKKIVTTNMYYIEYVYRVHAIHVITVLRFMGVELVLIDTDAYYELICGAVKKAASSYDGFHRYSVLPYYEKPYDERYKLSHIHYVANLQEYRPCKEQVPIALHLLQKCIYQKTLIKQVERKFKNQLIVS
ncbi:MAG: hypothetical protein HQL08_10635, partial [Nitrospirae bacterium]|nr:hypothetical protein [Nitrospirota bacterium]